MRHGFDVGAWGLNEGARHRAADLDAVIDRGTEDEVLWNTGEFQWVGLAPNWVWFPGIFVFA